MPHYCVVGCQYNPDVPVHIFPNPDKFPDRFKTWVDLVGNGEHDYDYYRTKRVCDLHFTSDQKNRCRRLNAMAIPCLHLPGPAKIVAKSAAAVPTSTVPTSTEAVAERNIAETSSAVPLHVFQNPIKVPDRFKAWVKLVGGQNLQDEEVYMKKWVCDIHFTVRQKIGSNGILSKRQTL